MPAKFIFPGYNKYFFFVLRAMLRYLKWITKVFVKRHKFKNNGDKTHYHFYWHPCFGLSKTSNKSEKVETLQIKILQKSW